jgi:hypothetical protein
VNAAVTKKEVLTHSFTQSVQDGMTWWTAIMMKWLCCQFCIITYINYALQFGFLSQYIHYKWMCVEQDNHLVALVTINRATFATLVYDTFFVLYLMEQRFLLF